MCLSDPKLYIDTLSHLDGNDHYPFYWLVLELRALYMLNQYPNYSQVHVLKR
jgi:hypothetical protein